MQKQNSIKQNSAGGKSLFFRASAEDFKNIPGSPVVYWAGKSFQRVFKIRNNLGKIGSAKKGLVTGHDALFLKLWFEVASCEFSLKSGKSKSKWVPVNKGGEFRKWYGNNNYVVNWAGNGEELANHKWENGQQRSSLRNSSYFFKKAITWTYITSGKPSFRYYPDGFAFAGVGPGIFVDDSCLNLILGYTNSIPFTKFVNLIGSSTISLESGEVEKIPVLLKFHSSDLLESIIQAAIDISKEDWDSFETSWDFTTLPILQPDYRLAILSDTYSKLRAKWLENTLEMQRLEEENNSIFIDAYGLQDELTPDVPLSEITLTCNPHYRYKGDKTEAELEALLLADTMKEFISYAVGCMFGRYSLDKPGLILANQGETIEDYLAQIPSPTFSADDDNVIPVLDGDWFSDDVTERFFKFLHVTFGDEHFEENLQFIENALGKNIRKYFLKDFYSDHVRRYKKRPIYWMFSSSKGSFNVLIYMHRYRSDTVSVILNGYLREFRAKLNAKLSHLEKVGINSDSSKSEKTKAIKEIEKLKKVITEVEDYERDVLYPLATKQVEIDLDDGVKVNYNKFGISLRKVTGLTDKGK